MHSPLEIARNYVEVGIHKTHLSAFKMVILGIFAGMFIAFAGVASTVASSTITTASGAKLVSAIVFPAGMAMVLIAGSELFTGNTLIILAALEKKVTVSKMLKNWFFVFVGNFIGAAFVAWMVVYGGIPELFDEEPQFERNNEVPHLLILSNLIPSKGVYVLLDACKILKDKGYKFVCDFVGGESKEITKEVFEKAVDERGLNEIVYYKGPKYGDEKNEFFANSDIFVQPTLNDCFPLTLLEAMQYKLPIITTNEGAIEDIVTPLVNGIITISRTPEELSNNIALLLKEECQRRIFGENGYKIFKEKFTQEQFEENILKLLISVNGGG